jgi:hypothetical protein
MPRSLSYRYAGSSAVESKSAAPPKSTAKKASRAKPKKRTASKSAGSAGKDASRSRGRTRTSSVPTEDGAAKLVREETRHDGFTHVSYSAPPARGRARHDSSAATTATAAGSSARGGGYLGYLPPLVLVALVFGPKPQWLADSLANLTHVARSSGPWGVALYVAIHCVLVTLCFPGTMTMEWGAGALFGTLGGFAAVSAAKTGAAAISFALGRGLLSEWARSKVGEDGYLSRAIGKVDKNPFKVTHDGTEGFQLSIFFFFFFFFFPLK